MQCRSDGGTERRAVVGVEDAVVCGVEVNGCRKVVNIIDKRRIWIGRWWEGWEEALDGGWREQ